MLLDAGVKLTEAKARYGAVEHGFVTVQGRMQDALYYGASTEYRTEVWLERLHSGEFGGRLGITKTFPDAIELEFLASTKENSGPIHVHLLEVGSCVASGKRGPVGLILREASRSQELNYRTFNRLGMFHIDKKAIKQQPLELDTEEWDRRVQSELCWFDGCDLEIVVIV